jgi:pimeloyl-ACP methyl ester carboxylesterase
MLIVIVLVLLIAILWLVGVYLTRTAEQQQPAIGKVANINSTEVHYLDTGNSTSLDPPVVFIHGVSCSLLDMYVAFASKLGAERRLIFIDRPGYGYSERHDEATSLKTQARLIDGLLEHLDIKNPIILGQSFGGVVSLAYALNHADRLAGLLLLAPVSHRWPGGVALYNHLALMPVIGPVFRYAFIPLYGYLAGRKAVENAFWPRQSPEDYYDKAGMALIFRPRAFKASAADIVALYDQVVEMEPHYKTINVPVRLICGTHDTAVLSTIHSRSLTQEIAGATLRYAAQTGHPVHHFAQDAVLEELAEIDRMVTAAAKT